MFSYMAGVFVISHLGAALLLAAGALKLRSEDRGLQALNVPIIPRILRTRTIATLAALAEIITGAVTLIWTTRLTLAVLAAWYLLFTVMIFLGIRAKSEDCGCLGARPSRPGINHLLINATVTIASLLIVTAPDFPTQRTDIARLIQHPTPEGSAYLLLIAAGAALLLAIFGARADISQILRTSHQTNAGKSHPAAKVET